MARRDEKRTVPAGTRLVRTDHRLGALAAYLLEPQSEDGLAAWSEGQEVLEGIAAAVGRTAVPGSVTSLSPVVNVGPPEGNA